LSPPVSGEKKEGERGGKGLKRGEKGKKGRKKGNIHVYDSCMSGRQGMFYLGKKDEHTAVHWNTLLCTAPHCYALQHTATHCSTL